MCCGVEVGSALCERSTLLVCVFQLHFPDIGFPNLAPEAVTAVSPVPIDDRSAAYRVVELFVEVPPVVILGLVLASSEEVMQCHALLDGPSFRYSIGFDGARLDFDLRRQVDDSLC
jgi:hypothetical protein